MRVLLGVDGSANAFAAVEVAGRHLSAEADTLHLYYTPPGLHARDASDEICQRARTALAQAIFDEARSKLPPPLAAKVQLIVGSESPRHGIPHAAHEINADLVVVGARGTGLMTRLLLGSVSTAVVRDAEVPVLVVRQRPGAVAGGPLRVLVAYDGPDWGHEVAEFLGRVSWAADSAAVVVGVIESLLAGAVPAWLEERARSADAEAMAQAWVREHEAEKQQKEQELRRYAATLPAVWQKDIRVVVAEGHPAEEILRLIDAERINLVVLGAHGHGVLERVLIGSTSEKVLAHAPCSVLVVRHDRTP